MLVPFDGRQYTMYFVVAYSHHYNVGLHHGMIPKLPHFQMQPLRLHRRDMKTFGSRRDVKKGQAPLRAFVLIRVIFLPFFLLPPPTPCDAPVALLSPSEVACT